MRGYMPASLLLSIGLLILAGGCAGTTGLSQHPADQIAALAQDKAFGANEMDFLDYMVRRPKCTFAHAVKAVTIFLDGAQGAATYEQQYQFLVDRHVVRPQWNMLPLQWVDRGTIAYMLYQAMDLTGGVNMTLFGSWGLGDRRFAYREMRYRKLVEAGVDYNYVSGPELVTLLGKVDSYMRDTGRYGAEDKVKLGEKTQY